MFDAYGGCTLPKMRLGARTSNRVVVHTEKNLRRRRRTAREDVRAVEML